MRFMNEWEILEACEKHAAHPVLANATRFLREFMTEVNDNSDGWSYWGLPVRAAENLIDLIENPQTATDEWFRRALKPIRAFYTRHGLKAGMKFPELDLSPPQKKLPPSAASASTADVNVQISLF